MLEVAAKGWNHPGIRDDRLDDDGRDPVRMGREGLADRGRLVERQHDRSRRDRSGDARAARDGLGGETGSCLDEQAVGMPVIGTRKLDHQVTIGRRPRDTKRAHHRFRPRRGEAHALDRWHRGSDRFAEIDLEGVGRAQGKAVPGGLGDRLDDRRMGVAEDCRTPRSDVVEESPSVGVPDIRPRASFEHDRRPADRAKRSNRAVDAAGKRPFGALDERRRPGADCNLGHQAAPSNARISSIDRWIPRRIGVSLTVERRLSVERNARTRSPNATRSSVS